MSRGQSTSNDFMDQFQRQYYETVEVGDLNLKEFKAAIDQVLAEVQRVTFVTIKVNIDQWKRRRDKWRKDWDVKHGGPSIETLQEIRTQHIWFRVGHNKSIVLFPLEQSDHSITHLRRDGRGIGTYDTFPQDLNLSTSRPSHQADFPLRFAASVEQSAPFQPMLDSIYPLPAPSQHMPQSDTPHVLHSSYLDESFKPGQSPSFTAIDGQISEGWSASQGFPRIYGTLGLRGPEGNRFSKSVNVTNKPHDDLLGVENDDTTGSFQVSS